MPVTPETIKTWFETLSAIHPKLDFDEFDDIATNWDTYDAYRGKPLTIQTIETFYVIPAMARKEQLGKSCPISKEKFLAIRAEKAPGELKAYIEREEYLDETRPEAEILKEWEERGAVERLDFENQEPPDAPAKQAKKQKMVINCGSLTVTAGKDEISNFLVTFVKRIDSDAGITWQLRLDYKTAKGEKSNVFLEIDGDALSSQEMFRKAVARKGMFLYSVKDVKEHNKYIKLMLSKVAENQDIRTFKKYPHLGMIDAGFLYHNALVKRDGTILSLDDAKVIPPAVTAGRMDIYNSPMEPEKRKEIGCMVVENLRAICTQQTWKVIGFTVATVYADVIRDKYAHFPLAFYYGTHGTGKSTIAVKMQEVLGCHRAIPVCAFGTPKSHQRTVAKFINCILLLNEFRSTESSNTHLCSYHDGEGYTRAVTDNTYNTNYTPVNSTVAVLSTHNITGHKSEDVHSRIVEISSDDFEKSDASRQAIIHLSEVKNNLSCLMPIILGIGKEAVMSEIAEVIDEFNALDCEQRAIENHAFLYACYKLFCQAIGIGIEKDVDFEVVKNQIQKQQVTIRESDLGMTFLKILLSMVTAGKLSTSENVDKVAKIENETILLFSLSEALPFVRQQGKSSDFGVADETTVATALKNLGCTHEKCRKLGRNKSVWSWNIPDGK